MLGNKIAYQITLCTHDNENTISACLNSIEDSMNQFNKEVKWILLIGDGDSKDNTLVEIGKYAERSSADKIHLFDYDYHEKRGINENKLIKETERFGEEYPLIMFMDPEGKMTVERPMMVFTALTYNVPWVVGAWKNAKSLSMTDYAYDAKEAANYDFYGSWATLFDVDFLTKQDKLFYESINKGRDVLAWKQLKHCQNISPTPHVRLEDPVHEWMEPPPDSSSKEIPTKLAAQMSFTGQTKDSCTNGMDPDLNPEDFVAESQLFLKMKAKLESGCDILKTAVD